MPIIIYKVATVKLCTHCKCCVHIFQVSFSFFLSHPSASFCSDPTQLLSNHRGCDLNQCKWQHQSVTPSNRLDRTSSAVHAAEQVIGSENQHTGSVTIRIHHQKPAKPHGNRGVAPPNR